MIRRATGSDNNTAEDVVARAIPLFAARGYAEVSMRDVAAEVGISGPALYHHFADKEALYLAVLEKVFSDRTQVMRQAVDPALAPELALKEIVATFANQVLADPNFIALLMRELLDSDEARLDKLSRSVFGLPFEVFTDLVRALELDIDTPRLALHILGFVMFPLMTAPLAKRLTGLSEVGDVHELVSDVFKILERLKRAPVADAAPRRPSRNKTL